MGSAIVASNCAPAVAIGSAASSSSSIRSNFASGAITLGDWIGRVRVKRREMRRKHANLRVAAVLSVTLRRAESEMRVRQAERARKWEELHQQIHRDFFAEPQSSSQQQQQEQQQQQQQPAAVFNDHVQVHQQLQHQQQQQQQQSSQTEGSSEQQQQAVDDIWRNELCDLDQFMLSLNAVKTCVVR